MALSCRLAFPAALVGGLAVALAPAADPPADPFARFADEYYAALFAADPVQATYHGVHDFDAKLPDLSHAAFLHRYRELVALATRLGNLRAGSLSPDDAIDAELLAHAIRAERLEIDTVSQWKTNPVVYLGKPAEGIDLLMKRSFAPPADRLRSVIGRLKMTPPLLAAMRANVDNPPKEFADLGLIVAKGSVTFFKETLPAWAKDAAGGDAELFAAFAAANKPVADGFEAAAAWVERDLLPRATGSFALGTDAFMAKLAAEEMVDIPLPKLLAIGEANLEKDRAAFVATAKLIDPKATPEAVLAKLTDDHPKAADLVAATRGTLERTRQFLIDKQVVTVPSEVRPTVAETPPFMRTGGFASMDTPGAFEATATEAFYYVTPPEKDWDARRQDELLRQFNPTAMDVITVHEAFPGHYLQFLYAKHYPTKVRKLYTCGTNVEGWAHYAEQMVVDEGYGNGDPKVRLAQLSEALLRDCRFVVGIKLHTAGWTVEQGKTFFMEKGFVEGETAFQESRRGTYNPTYLYYTLGKLQILKLRDDYKRAKGPAYTLKGFHDAFVRQGGLPLKVMRKMLLPGDTGPGL